MAWTTPRTWLTGEILTAALLNTHLKDNLDYLKAAVMAAPVSAVGAGEVTTTSTSYVDMTDMSCAVVTAVTINVLLVFEATFRGSSTNTVSVQFTDSANALVGTADIVMSDATNRKHETLMCIDQISANKTYKVRWKTSANDAYAQFRRMYAIPLPVAV